MAKGTKKTESKAKLGFEAKLWLSADKKPIAPSENGNFEALVVSIVRIHQQAHEFATKAVNTGLTLRNWFIGHRIVEFEQQGRDRAAYGERLLPALAERLAAAGLKRVDAGVSGVLCVRRNKTYPQRRALAPQSAASVRRCA